jgi:Protein of unknown function (DUF3455)
MHYTALRNHVTRRIMLIACTTTLAVGLMVSLPQSAHAQTVTPPPVPQDIKVPEGNEAYLVGHATGTQNYVCSPCDPTKPNCPLGVAFTLFTPQANLFDDEGEQIITHFTSPNPNENGITRVSWQDSRDTSIVWATLVNAVMVREDSIPWVLLNVNKDTGSRVGPTGGDRLTKTTFIQRIRTFGGKAPSTDCLSSLDLGHQAFVPYRADYFFYKKSPTAGTN